MSKSPESSISFGDDTCHTLGDIEGNRHGRVLAPYGEQVNHSKSLFCLKPKHTVICYAYSLSDLWVYIFTKIYTQHQYGCSLHKFPKFNTVR